MKRTRNGTKKKALMQEEEDVNMSSSEDSAFEEAAQATAMWGDLVGRLGDDSDPEDSGDDEGVSEDEEDGGDSDGDVKMTGKGARRGTSGEGEDDDEEEGSSGSSDESESEAEAREDEARDAAFAVLDKQDEQEGQSSSASSAQRDIALTTQAAGSRSKVPVKLASSYLAFESDSEDSEGDRNRIGNVPLEWYDEFDHIGYDIHGKRIARSANRGDEIDAFLARSDDPDHWRKIYDAKNDRTLRLSDEELNMLHRIRHGKFAHRGFNPYEELDIPMEKRLEPLGNPIEPKRRFVPSKYEAMMVRKFVIAIRNGWIRDPKDREKQTDLSRDGVTDLGDIVDDPSYDLWGAGDEEEEEDDWGLGPMRKGVRPKSLPPMLPPPKMRLPGHEESYNPPAEYLPTAEELEQRKAEEEEDPDLRKRLVPQKYDALRRVPQYPALLQERFQRCLDLYLCPRVQKTRLNIDPKSLLPSLPKPRELRPFPSVRSLEFRGHRGLVRTISVSPDGQWLASGSDDLTVRVWEIGTGRLFNSWTFDELIDCVAWNPERETPLLAVASGSAVTLLHTLTGSAAQTAQAEKMLTSAAPLPPGEKPKKPAATWTATVEENRQSAIGQRALDAHGGLAALTRVVVETGKRVTRVTWHARGDYFASVCSHYSSTTSVLLHRLSRNQTQAPFKRSKGFVQCVCFHPSQPLFVVASKRNIRIYNLLTQTMQKKLVCPARWISSIAIHPGGDNLIMGSHDRRVCWFDLELSSRPYKTLKYHKRGVRRVAFHNKYPLFASASDDGRVHVFHGMVYNDLLTNPLIVPVKILPAHQRVDELGVLDCAFHPTQPWLFTAGADQVIRLFT